MPLYVFADTGSSRPSFFGKIVESAWVWNTVWHLSFSTEGGYCAQEGDEQPGYEQPRRVRFCVGGGQRRNFGGTFAPGILQLELRAHNVKSLLSSPMSVPPAAPRTRCHGRWH